MIRGLTAAGPAVTLLVLAGCGLASVVRQPAPAEGIAPAHLSTQARFTDATSLSITGDGGLLVVDRGERRLIRISTSGSLTRVPLQTRRPSAVDASSGLRLLVADESEGAIDILGLQGNLIRRLRVPADADRETGQTPSQEFLDDRDGLQATGGRPADLAALADGGIVAIEGFAGFLAFWDEAGRLSRTVSEAGGRPFRAVRLAASPRQVSAIDGESGHIHVFDHLGSYARTLVTAEMPLALGYDGDTLWVADQSRIWRAEGGTGGGTRSGVDAPLTAETAGLMGLSYSLGGLAEEVVDLAVTPSAFYLLTPRALLRMDR